MAGAMAEVAMAAAGAAATAAAMAVAMAAAMAMEVVMAVGMGRQRWRWGWWRRRRWWCRRAWRLMRQKTRTSASADTIAPVYGASAVAQSACCGVTHSPESRRRNPSRTQRARRRCSRFAPQSAVASPAVGARRTSMAPSHDARCRGGCRRRWVRHACHSAHEPRSNSRRGPASSRTRCSGRSRCSLLRDSVVRRRIGGRHLNVGRRVGDKVHLIVSFKGRQGGLVAWATAAAWAVAMVGAARAAALVVEMRGAPRAVGREGGAAARAPDKRQSRRGRGCSWCMPFGGR